MIVEKATGAMFFLSGTNKYKAILVFAEDLKVGESYVRFSGKNIYTVVDHNNINGFCNPKKFTYGNMTKLSYSYKSRGWHDRIEKTKMVWKIINE